jgi:hypothetical protein
MPKWFSKEEAYINRPNETTKNSASWSYWTVINADSYTKTPTFTKNTVNASIPYTQIQPAERSGKKLYYNNLTRMDTLGEGNAVINLNTLRQIKAGYGIMISQAAVVNQSGATQMRDATVPQAGHVYFPEFLYKKGGVNGVTKPFNRMLLYDRAKGTLEMSENPYDDEALPWHFLPIWYPRTQINKVRYEHKVKEPYAAYVETTDAWTPSGKLSTNNFSFIAVKRNYTYDYHIAPGYGGEVDSWQNDEITIDNPSDD